MDVKQIIDDCKKIHNSDYSMKNEVNVLKVTTLSEVRKYDDQIFREYEDFFGINGDSTVVVFSDGNMFLQDICGNGKCVACGCCEMSEIDPEFKNFLLNKLV